MLLTSVANEISQTYPNLETQMTDWIHDGQRTQFGLFGFDSTEDALSEEACKVFDDNTVYYYLENKTVNKQFLFVHDRHFIPILIDVFKEVEKIVFGDTEVLQESELGKNFHSKLIHLQILVEFFQQKSINEKNKIMAFKRMNEFQEVLNALMRVSPVVMESEYSKYARHLKNFLKKQF